MARHITFEVHARTTASPGEVFPLVAAGRSWPEWSPIGSFRLEREGRDGGESEGAVRAFRTGFVTSREVILETTPDEVLRYSAFSGLPLRGHEAEVRLTAEPGGTLLTWRESFVPAWPGSGWWLRWSLRRFVRQCVEGLAARATADAAAARPADRAADRTP
jgi:hypothetical protein